MKRMLQLFLLGFAAMSSTDKVQAQNVYWREGFSEGQGNFPTAVADGVPGSYRTQDNSGTWYVYGVYRTTGATGSCPTETGDASHLRFGNLSAVTSANDSAYLVTPVVNFGISKISFLNGRAARRFSIFKTSDTLATTANWTLVTLVPLTNVACQATEVTVNDAAARRIKLVSRGGTDSDLDSIVLTSVNVIMPVSFTGLKASINGSGIKLDWSNATESNINRYAIERSSDGRSFTEVASVNAIYNQSSDAFYTWSDVSPLNGNNFYRIRAFEKGGGYAYTSIVKVSSGKNSSSINVSPNPVKGNVINLQFANVIKDNYSISLFNNVGQKVFTKNITIDGGSSTLQLQLPSSVVSGAYNLQLTTGETTLNKKLLVE